MSLRVLLINPPPNQFSEPWYDKPSYGRLGLVCLAGYLRKFSDFEIKIIDSKFEKIDFRKTLQRTIGFAPQVVGLTAFTNEIKPAAHMAKLIKERLPDVATVIGGVHLTALPRETLREFPSFDVGVIGEGEITFYELCKAIEKQQSINSIYGLVIRQNGDIHITPTRGRVGDLDSIIFPAWDLLPPADVYHIMTQRGCPFFCIFCMNPNGGMVRPRAIENVIAELEWVIERYHPREIYFCDETFTVNKERTKKFLRTLIDRNLNRRISWIASTHVACVDEELFVLMKEANVKKVGLGIETGDEEKIKEIGKAINIDLVLRAREAARRAKVPIETYFIFGQPNETMDSMKKTIALAVKLNPDLPVFGIMVPYPGTQVSTLASRGEGGYKLLTTDWNKYNKQIGGSLEFAHLPRSAIERIQLKAYAKVFLSNHRYLDFIRFVWRYRHAGVRVLAKIMTGGLRELSSALR